MYRSSDKIVQLPCKLNHWRKGTPTADASTSDEENRQRLRFTVKIIFFDSKIGSFKNIFPTDLRQNEVMNIWKSYTRTADQPIHHDQQWVLQKALFYNKQLRTPRMCDVKGIVTFVNKILREQNFCLNFHFIYSPKNIPSKIFKQWKTFSVFA